MKRTCALLAMLVSLGFTSSVEVGSQGFSNNMPFCADWTESLRYQVMVPSSEFSGAMTIGSISFDPVPGTGSRVTLDAFSIDMGYCAAGELDPSFDTNYVSGSKTRVFERSTSFVLNAVMPWTSMDLDTPFFYDPSAGNLIFEIQWPDGSGQFYAFHSNTLVNSLVIGNFGATYGDAFQQTPHLLLEGEEAFNQMTFAGIKATFK